MAKAKMKSVSDKVSDRAVVGARSFPIVLWLLKPGSRGGTLLIRPSHLVLKKT